MTIAAAIQMNSTDDVKVNLHSAKRLLQQAAAAGAKLAVLPENFALMAHSPGDLINYREKMGQGTIQEFLAEQASKLSLWIVAGSIPLSFDNNKVYSAALVFNAEGRCINRYDKIHLFDATVSEKEQHQESRMVEAGKEIIVVDSPVGKLGVAICYDIRFPELFRHMLKQGAEVFALPAAFTVPTGQAHWKVLTRSRAIENQCYFIAACQSGNHTNGRSTYGRSLIIDPWGKILALISSGEGVITAPIDLHYLQQVRSKMPIQLHQKLI